MSPSQRRRPPNLNLGANSNNVATPSKPPPVPILKSRDPVPRTPPNRRAQAYTSTSNKTRANPMTAVSRAVKSPQPSSSNAPQHADENHDASLVTSTSSTPATHRTTSSSAASDPADLDVDRVPPLDMSNKENEYGPRDSHDLSMPHSQSTRDSLMASMLLSLDQLTLLGQSPSTHANIYDDSSRNYSSSYGAAMPPNLSDDRTWTKTSRASRPNTSSRFGPSHGHSYSSDLEAGDDAARLNMNRARRSNSNSTFQTSGPTRMNSMRESVKSSQPSTPRRLHTRGGKGSKSSSANSIDAGYVQVLGSQRWASGFGTRSSSFDYGHRRVENTQPAWHADFTHTFLNDDYDAAPTPTVPGGPRRTAPPTPVTATFMSSDPMPLSMPEPRTPTLERKRSTRSARSMASSGRKGESKFTTREVIPPVPNFTNLDLDSAPAPHVGYEKTKETIPGGVGGGVPSPSPYVVTTPQPKERPGFFRRVFGSSRNTTPTSSVHDLSHSPAHFSSSTNGNADRHVQQTISSQTRSNSTPSRDGNSPSNTTHSPHVLQKKPSSFFRRRKKSVHDSEAPPMPTARPEEAPPLPSGPLVPPVSLQPNLDKLSAAPEPSPVSSLRKVMSPYLRGSPTVAVTPLSAAHEQHVQHAGEVEGYKRDFSPDYEPSPKAIIRTVDQNPSPSSPDISSSASPRLDTPDRPPPDIPHSSGARNDSFLDLDPPSDNELDLASSTPSARAKTATRKPPAATTPGATDREDETDEGNRAEAEDDDIMLAAHSGHLMAPRVHRDRRGDDTFKPIRRRIRAALDITDSEEEPNSATLALPIEGARSTSAHSDSAASGYRTSPANTPSVRVELTSDDGRPRPPHANDHVVEAPKDPIDEPDFVVGDPTDDDRQKAQKIFDGNEDFIQKDKAAAWMGAEGLVRQRTLRAYMELYDFTDLSIAASLRQVCGRLVMRAETQQIDRILLAYATRWARCNANHGFKSIGKLEHCSPPSRHNVSKKRPFFFLPFFFSFFLPEGCKFTNNVL